MSRRGWALFSAMCVIWGIPYLLIKVAVDVLNPVTLVFLRTGVGALILLPLAQRRGGLRPLLTHWRLVLLYTVVEVGIPWLLLSDAETRLSSSLAGMLVAAVPLVGLALSVASGGSEQFGVRRVAGLLCGLVGVGVLLGFDVHAGDVRAVMEMAVVTVGYAVGPMLIARQLRELPAMGVIAASLGITTLVYLPLALTNLPAAVPPARVFLSLAILGVVCTAAAFVVFFALINEVGPVRATVITYVNPAVAVLLGVALLGERFTATTAIGFVLILGGSILATGRTRRSNAPVVEAPLADGEVEPLHG
ncbi:MAG: DMT family transporter [Candidatus Dormibacteria bacterium]